MKIKIMIILISSFISLVILSCYVYDDLLLVHSDHKYYAKQNKSYDTLRKEINAMTIDEKIGQLVISGVNNTIIDNKTKELINDFKVGGFILMGENCKNIKQMLTLINSLKSENSVNKIPLFLGIDEEGGRIIRIPKDFSRLPTNKTIGVVNSTNFSYDIGCILGQELKAFGLNLDFAPVMDINTNPKNPIIGDRSFGNNADLVSKLGIQTMKGIQSQNIISTIKHFPGHGDTSVDSHKGLPIVNSDINRLNRVELVPFAQAINSGADIIMVAHILIPKVDTKKPATMSKALITEILRKRLKFHGVVITDDMTMGAITKNYDIGKAAVTSLQAGSDIILVCHGYNNEIKVINSIKSAVLKGVVSEKAVDEKLYRILMLKKKYSLNSEQVSLINPKMINDKIDKLKKTYLK